MKKFKIREKRILMGVDCSYHSTGVSVLEGKNLIHNEKITTGKDERVCQYLDRLRNNVVSVIKQYNVEHVAMEELNFSSNFKTTTALLRAQGSIMSGVHNTIHNEVEMYNNATWRSKLSIKNIRYQYVMKDVKDRKTGKIKQVRRKIKENVLLNGKKVVKDIKYLTIVRINELYNLQLGYEDNDVADAIGIVTALLYDVEKYENC